MYNCSMWTFEEENSSISRPFCKIIKKIKTKEKMKTKKEREINWSKKGMESRNESNHDLYIQE